MVKIKWGSEYWWEMWKDHHGYLRCELANWLAPCDHNLQAHHIISKGLLQGNEAALKYVEERPHFFGACVCGAHNMILADSTPARLRLLTSRLMHFGPKESLAYLQDLNDLLAYPLPLDIIPRSLRASFSQSEC